VLAAATWTIAVAVLVGGLVREGLGDLLFFAIIWGGPAFLLAALLGYALGRSGRRAVAVAIAGCLGVVGLILWAYLASSPTDQCYDCGEILGRWMSPVLVMVLCANLLTWPLGALAGSWLRRR